MPWNILIIILVLGQFLLILYMRDNHNTTVEYLTEQVDSLRVSNERLSQSVKTCEGSKKDAIEFTETILKDTIVIEREQHRIESELDALGWRFPKSNVVPIITDDGANVGDVNETIKPNDVFDDSINRLLQDAYNCATSRTCVYPDS